MQTLLLAYIAAYAVVWIVAFAVHIFAVPQEAKADDPAWETPVDLLLLGVGLVGMLLLALDYHSQLARDIWKVVSIVLIAAQLFLNLRARARHMARTAEQPDVHTRIADLGLLLFLMPSFGLNLAFAFAR